MMIDNLVVFYHGNGQAHIVQAVAEGLDVLFKGRFGALPAGEQARQEGRTKDSSTHINNQTFLQG